MGQNSKKKIWVEKFWVEKIYWVEFLKIFGAKTFFGLKSVGSKKKFWDEIFDPLGSKFSNLKKAGRTNGRTNNRTNGRTNG